jgi:hypothetical protein
MELQKDNEIILQVLLSKTSDGGYEAHCLQMDVVAEAATMDEAVDELCELIRVQYRYGRDTNNLESVFVPAPKEYWQKLAHAKPIGTLRNIDLSGRSEHCVDDVPSYALQELEVAVA